MKERIRTLRKELKFTQSEFARRLGLCDATVGHWEKGRQIPPKNAIVAICREFGVNRDWLEHGSDPMFATVNDDPGILKRRLIAELFNSLPDDLQKIILESISSAYSAYFEKQSSENIGIVANNSGTVHQNIHIEK